jgi:hypothetical protein
MMGSMGSMWRRFQGGNATGTGTRKEKKKGPESDPRPVAGRHHTASTTRNGKVRNNVLTPYI